MTQAWLFANANAGILTWIAALLDGAKDDITVQGEDSDDPPTIVHGPLYGINDILTEDRTRSAPKPPFLYVGFGEQVCTESLSEGRVWNWTAAVNILAIAQNGDPYVGGAEARNYARMADGVITAASSQATRPACVHDVLHERFVPSTEQYLVMNADNLYCSVAVLQVKFLTIDPETLADLVT